MVQRLLFYHEDRMKNACRGTRRAAFTLVELLVVIAIIGILVALLLPAVHMAREASRRTDCQNHLRQIGLAITNFESAKRLYPPGQQWSGDRRATGTIDFGWGALLLPYLEEKAIFDQLDFEQPYTAATNRVAAGVVISTYLCPSTSLREEDRSGDDRILNWAGHAGLNLGCIDYLGISGPDKDATNPVTNQAYGPQRGVLLGTKGLADEDTRRMPPALKVSAITDGLTKTLCVTECTGRGTQDDGDPTGAWISGRSITHVEAGVNSKSAKKSWEDELIYAQHTSGAQGLFLGGSVHPLPDDLDETVLRALCSRNGEETVNQEF